MMNKDLTQELYNRYPVLFPNLTDGPNRFFGFECADGWYHIIDEVCDSIIDYVTETNRVRQMHRQYKEFLAQDKEDEIPSWFHNWGELVKNIPEDLEMPVVQQIKEKFGTMSFYMTHEDQTIRSIIGLGAALSGHTCEECGNSATMIGGGWIKTLCPEHAAVKIARDEKRKAEREARK